MKKLLLFVMIPLSMVAGSISPGYGQSSLKVGALIPFISKWGDSGRECAKGLLDGAKSINQRGGIFGRKLEILLVEDNSEPIENVAAYRKLNEADHILLLYIYSAETALGLLPHVNFNRIPTLVSSLPSELVNPVTSPSLFTVAPTPLDLAKIAIQFISEQSGMKTRRPKMVFIGSSSPVSPHFLDEARKLARRSGLEVGPDTWISEPSPSGRPLSSLPLSITSFNPDFAYLSLSPKESFALLSEARRTGLKTTWIANRKAFDETLSPFEGVFGVQPVAAYGEDLPGMVGIREAHQKWHPFDSHTLSYVEGWATVQVIAEALGKSLPEQKLSRERIKGSLESFKDFVLGGLLPPLTITATDHRPSVESRILIIKEARLMRYTGFLSSGR